MMPAGALIAAADDGRLVNARVFATRRRYSGVRVTINARRYAQRLLMIHAGRRAL